MSELASALQSVMPPGPWSVERSFRFCQEVARRDTHNFPVATWLMPASVRPYAACLYAFARLADNFADEPRYAGQRETLLDAWSAALDDCYVGRATHPVFIALRETVAAFDIPPVYLRALLGALRQDLSVTRYATRDDLMDYCGRSANSAGRLVLLLLDIETNKSIGYPTRFAPVTRWSTFGKRCARIGPVARVYIPQRGPGAIRLRPGTPGCVLHP